MASKRDIVVSLEFNDKGTAKIKKAVTDVRTTLSGTGDAAGKAGAGFDKLRQKSDAAAKSVGTLKNAAGGLKQMILSMAAGMGIATGISAIFGKLRQSINDVITTAREFGHTWVLTTTMMTGTTEEIVKMKGELLRMSPTLGTAKDLAWGLYQVLSASVPAENAIAFLGEASKAAQAGATDTFTAVDALTTVINAYGMAAERVGHVSDIMFQTVKRGKTTYPQLAGALGTVVPMAAQVGVSFEEIGAAISTLTRQGIDVNTTTVQLRQILATVLGPGEQAASMARQLGLEFSSAAVAEKGLVGFLQDVLAKTGGNVDVLNMLFGNIRALTGVMGLASQGAKEFAGDLDLMNNSLGASQEAFEKQMQSTGFWLTAIKNSIDKFKIGLFGGVTEGFFKGIKTQKEYQEKFEKWAQSMYDKGKKVGESIHETLQTIAKLGKELLKLAPIIERIIKLWLTWKAVSIGTSLIGGVGALAVKLGDMRAAMQLTFEGKGLMGKARNLGTLLGKGLQTPIMGVTGALKAVVPAAGAAFAGWQIGRLIGEITGLDKVIQKMFEGIWKAKDRTGGLTGRHEELAALQKAMKDRASELSGKKVTNVLDSKQLLEAEFKKTGTLGSQILDDWAKSLGWVKAEVKEATGAVTGALNNLLTLSKESKMVQMEALTVAGKIAGQKVTELAAAEAILRTEFEKTGTLGSITLDAWIERSKKTGMTLIDMKAKLKEYGYTLKMELAERYQVLTTILTKFGNELTKADYKRIREEVKALGVALGKTSEAFAELGLLTSSEEQERISDLAGWLGELNKKFLSGELPLWKYEKGLAAIQERLEAISPYLKAGLKGIEEIVATPLPAPKKFTNEQLTAMAPVAFELEPVQQYVEWLMHASKASETLGVTLKHDLVLNLENLEKAFASLQEKGQLTPETMKQAANTLIGAYKVLGMKVPKELEGIAVATTDVWEGVSETMVDYWTQAMAEMIKSGLNFRDIINTAWQTMATGAGKAIGNLATNALKSLGKMAGPIGGLIGTVAGTVISGIGKLFGIKSKAQKEAEAAKKAEAELKRQVEATTKAYKAFGDITESTAKKIVELTKQFNKQTATILTLTDVMNDAGISTKNLTLYLQKMVAALRDIAAGRVDAQKGIDAIGSAFQQIVGWAQKFGGEGKKALTNFISYLRQIGVSIAEVDEYVFSQLEKGAAGLEAMVESVGGASYKQLLDYKEQIKTLGEEVKDLSGQRLSDRAAQQDYLRKKAQLQELQDKYQDLQDELADGLAPELERVSRLTLTTFNAFIAQGKGWGETIALMKDSLTGLRDRYTELGITGGAAIQELFKIVDLGEANAGLLEGIEGNKQLLEALGNTGFLTADAMTDLSDQAESYFNKLVEGGADAKQALAMIAPQLADLDYYAKQYGLSLDDGTKALIEQAKAAGVYRERGKDLATSLKEGFDGIVGKLNELIDLFGGRGGLIDRMREGLEYGKQYSNLNYATGGPAEVQRTMAQTGFKGVVTGPRLFEIEKGVTEAVHIGTPNEVFNPASLVNTANMMTRIKESVTRSVSAMVNNMVAIVEQQASATMSEFAFAGPQPAMNSRFYVQPAAQERVAPMVKDKSITNDEEKIVVIDKKITIEPVVIPMREFESFLIKFVQKASADERVLVRPRSVRGRG